MAELRAHDRVDFHVAIMNAIVDHPDWAATAMKAVADGIEIAQAHAAEDAATALAEANERAARYEMAMRCALSLADPARLSADVETTLNLTICKAINHEHPAEIERKFLERTGNAEAF
jgi:hypothetical protein